MDVTNVSASHVAQLLSQLSTPGTPAPSTPQFAMKVRLILVPVFVATLVCLWQVQQVRGASLYINTSNSPPRIQSLDLITGSLQAIVTSTILCCTAGRGIEVDPKAGKMYFNWIGEGIYRANLDGTAKELVVQQGSAPAIATFRLDLNANKIFFNYGDEAIRSADLNGSNQQAVIVSPIPGAAINSFALNPDAKKIFFVASPTTQPYILLSSINSINYDGTNLSTMLSVPSNWVQGLFPDNLEVDTLHRRLYWADRSTLTINSAKLVGSDISSVLSWFNSPQSFRSFTIDPIGRKIYWSTFETDPYQEILSANLDGTGKQVLIQSRDDPWGLAIGPLPRTKITIDIKPGDFPNSINPKEEGVVPVAILSSSTFDAATVNSATIFFGRNGTEAPALKATMRDVNHDGRPDMVVYFRTEQTGIKCGDISASLSAQTFSGQAIKGSDSIRTVGCGKSGEHEGDHDDNKGDHDKEKDKGK